MKGDFFIGSSQPLISIITPTYNRRNFLPLTLNSLVNQSYKNIEIVVVNDAGVDVSDIIDGYKDSRIKYFVNEKNKDLAGTRNVALKNSTGDYICLLDDDDQFLPYTLEFRMYMMNKLNADVVYGRALKNIMEKRVAQNGQEYYQVVDRTLYWDSVFDKDLILIQNICPCNCPLFSRRAQESAGYFDESLSCSEDWSMWVEMSRHYDFHELKLVDCECTFKTDASQMTGSRTGFSDHLSYLYKKWRAYAKDLKFVVQHQNAALKSRGLPEILD
jgi:glycosyltransferase involved in cell wall biosynthesis